MPEEKTINENILRMTGSFNLPATLKNAHDYKLLVEGSIDGITERPNYDGTFNFIHKFKPITGEIINEKGKSMTLKDKTSESVKNRRLLMGVAMSRGWEEDTFYAQFWGWFRSLDNFDQILEMFEKSK